MQCLTDIWITQIKKIKMKTNISNCKIMITNEQDIENEQTKIICKEETPKIVSTYEHIAITAY